MRSSRGAQCLRMTALTPGQLVGDYRLERQLGAGSFAEVWLAVDSGALGFRKRVALKVLNDLSADSPARFETLVNEARLCGHLHHPHIVDVYGVSEHEGRWMIAMEYVEGTTLAVLSKRVRGIGLTLPASVILDLGVQIAQALEHAHAATDHAGRPLHVIHRDLKPANVLVNAEAGAKVADFGIARAVTNVGATETGVTKGTPCYLAPEAWQGEPIGPAVDVFALAAVLSELVTGKRLYDGQTVAEIIFRIVQGSPHEDIGPVAGLFPQLAPLLLRMLARDPAERIGRAADVVRELDRIRQAIRPTGSLSLFLKLLKVAGSPHGLRKEGLRGLELPATDEPAWSRLVGIVRGEGSTVQSFTPQAPMDPTATRRVDRPALEAALAEAVPEPPRGTPEIADHLPETRELTGSEIRASIGPDPVGTPTLVAPGAKPREDAGDLVFQSASSLDAVPTTRAEPRPARPPRQRTSPGRRRPRRRAPVPRWLLGLVGVMLLAVVVIIAVALSREGPGPSVAEAPPRDLPILGDTSPDQPATPVPATPTPRPTRTRAATRPSPEPETLPEASPAPTAEVVVQPTPEPEETTPAPPTEGCVVFVSFPTGSVVWLDGVMQSKPGRRDQASFVTLRPGPKTIQMALRGKAEPTHEAKVRVQAGWRHVVTCTVTSANKECTVTETRGSCP